MPGIFEFTDRVVPITQIGIGGNAEDGPALWDVARWDDPGALWSGVEPTWRDVSCDVIEARSDAGRDRVFAPFPVGLAEVVVDNASGWADPDPTASESPGGALQMRPGRAIRIGVRHVVFGDVWLWRGWVDTMEPRYAADAWDEVRMRCVDALGEGGRDQLAQTVETGDGETADTRIKRILNAEGWPTSKRSIQATSVGLYAAALEGQVVDLLTRCADSAAGVVFADTTGGITFKNKDWLLYETGTPPDATIGNQPGDVCPVAWDRTFDRADIAAKVIVQRLVPAGVEPPAPIVATDQQVRDLYGPESDELGDLWTKSDSQARGIALRRLNQRSPELSMPRIRAVEVDAATGDDVIDLACQLDLGAPSRYRCRHILERGVVFDDEFFAVGVSHEIAANRWNVRISLDRAEAGRLDPAPYRWDTARWSHALWN